MKPKIVFLYGSAGGGHKSVATALTEAMQAAYGDKIDTEMVDIIDYAPKPFDKTAEAYQRMIKNPQVWKQFYELQDGPTRAKLVASGMSLYGRRAAKAILSDHPTDIYVSVFHFAMPMLDYLVRNKIDIPYVTVVTDLVTAPPIWFDPRVDMCIVPTEVAKQLALEAGINNARIKVTGLPISTKFYAKHAPKAELRQKFGWPDNRTVILLMAGGEGVGPLQEIGQAISAQIPDAALVIVTGKNTRLKSQLESLRWQIPVFIYGFSTEIDEFMYASDIFVTKAGPTNITEAFACGLPMVIYGHLPGQEEGNVTYVTDEGAGVWAPTPDEVVTAIQRWMKYPAQLRAAASTSKALSTPHAGRDIAKVLAAIALDQARLKQTR